MPGTNIFAIEIPAVYQKEPHPELLSAMRNDNPGNNLRYLSSYLLPVDRALSEEHGFMDDDIPELIVTDGIEPILEENK